MQDVLFLAHRAPYPPDKGDKIRSWHLLNWLTERYRVHLGCFVDDPADWAHVDVLHERCASTCLIPLRPWPARVRYLRAIADGQPLTFAHFRSTELSRWAQTVHRERSLAAQIAFSSAMAPYLMKPGTFSGVSIVDLVDVDSAKWASYAERRGAASAWLYRREAKLLAAAEQEAVRSVDAGILVSEDEARLFRTQSGAAPDNLLVIGNGVDTAYFDPDTTRPNPFGGDTARDGPANLVFTGAMDYWPNVDAVVWFSTEILPIIRQTVPGARFHIVGSRPSPQVKRLESASVSVTGRVPDVRPYLQHADLVVAPLRLARGVQNKVLEGMAMARPLVCTPAAFSGIEARPSHDALVAVEPEELAASCVRLLQSGAMRQVFGSNARRLVQARYGWPARLAPLQGLLDRSTSSSEHSTVPLSAMVG